MTISKDTIIRSLVLIVALINQVLTTLGKNPLPFSDDLIYELITVMATVAASIVAWWKNNSFTKKAILADNYLHNLKEKTE